MARPRQIENNSAEDAPFEAIDVEHDDVSGLVEEQREEEKDILSHFGAVDEGVKMHFQVHKVRKDSKITDWCFEGTRDDFPIVPRIQSDFGGGTYKIMIFKNGRLFRSPSLGVMEPRRSPVAAPTADPNFAALVDLLRRREEQPRPAGPSMLETMTGIAAIVTAAAPILSMVLKGNGGNSTKDTLEMLATAKELFGNNSEDREKSPLEMAGEILVPMFAGMQNKPTPQLEAPRPPQIPARPTPEQIKQAEMAQLQQQLRYMITRAQKNSPPELYADLLDDMLPPEQKQLLCLPGAIDMIGTLEPAILTYRPWFEAVLKSLAEAPTDENGDALEDSATHVSERSPSGVTVDFNPGRIGGGSHNAAGDDSQNEGGQN